MKKKTELKWFLLVFIIGAFLRLLLMDYASSGLQADETEVMVEAMSLIETGMDREGYAYPWFFAAFGEGEAPLLSYILAGSFSIFGKTHEVALMTVVFLSIVTLVTTYFAIREFLNKHIALFVMLILGISPWHLNISNLIYNVSIVLLFYTLGYYLWESGWGKKSYLRMIGAGISFGISFYCYSLSWLWIILWLAVWVVSKHKEERNIFKKDSIKRIFVGVLPIIFIAAPLGIWLFIMGRMHVIWGVIEFPFIESIRAVNLTTEDSALHIAGILKNYIMHFSPSFWLWNTNNLDFIPFFGIIYIAEIPFLIVGARYLFQNRKKYIFFWLWFFAAFIPPSLTDSGVPHPLRSLGALTVIHITIAFGAWIVFRKLRDENVAVKKIAWYVVIVSFVMNVVIFQIILHGVGKKRWTYINGYGSEEMVKYVEEHQEEYDSIVIDSAIIYWTYFPMYSQSFRREFQEIDSERRGDNTRPKQYGNICFQTHTNCAKSGKTLLITKEREGSEGEIIQSIRYPNSKSVAIEFRVVEYN